MPRIADVSAASPDEIILMIVLYHYRAFGLVEIKYTTQGYLVDLFEKTLSGLADNVWKRKFSAILEAV